MARIGGGADAGAFAGGSQLGGGVADWFEYALQGAWRGDSIHGASFELSFLHSMARRGSFFNKQSSQLRKRPNCEFTCDMDLLRRLRKACHKSGPTVISESATIRELSRGGSNRNAEYRHFCGSESSLQKPS